MIEFKTYKFTFLRYEKSTIVLDITDFGYKVGEVELMAKDAEKTYRDIEESFREYAWFFDTRKPKGKLTVYFEKFGGPKWEM